MKVYTNHSHSHDIYELVKIFFPKDDIDIVAEDDGWDIASILDGQRAISKLRNRGKLLENSIDLWDFTIFEDLGNWQSKLLKHSLYQVLKEKEDKAWGFLTGMRPGKIARSIEDLRYDCQEILRDYFFVSEEKAGLIKYIVDLQRPIIENYREGYSLYINIPFCPSICSYCSYSVLPINKYREIVPDYISHLLKEIELVLSSYGKPSMVYIGGGTPSAIDPTYLIQVIDKALSLGPVDEFTVELGRSDTIGKDLLRALSSRVDRICINPQTMNEGTVKSIGRKQTNEGILKSFEEARKYNFSINMDTILGLPGEDEDDVYDSFDKILDLGPDNITVHSLSMKKGSELRQKGYHKRPDIKELIDISKSLLIEDGYIPYYLYRQKDILGDFENIGYAKKDSICSYNIVSMEESQTIIATGMGAVSKFIEGGRPYRVANFKSLDDYFTRFGEILQRKLR